MQQNRRVTKHITRAEPLLVPNPLTHGHAHLILQIGNAEKVEDGNTVGFSFDFDILISVATCGSAGDSTSRTATFFRRFRLGGGAGAGTS